jgi:uncharacterized membrane protein
MRPTAFVVSCLLASVSSIYAEQPDRTLRVEMEILGSFPNAQWTMPVAINNRGHIAGNATNVEGVDIAFIWTRTRGFELIAERAIASDINDRGHVVGRWQACEDCPTNGFIWSGRDGFRDLGPNFWATSINNRGDMAGNCPSPQGSLVPCRMLGDVLEFASCEGSCVGGEANSINARGDVVGSFDDAGTFTNAFLWRRDGSQITLDPGPPAPNAFLVALGRDINNRGFVVGKSGAGTAAFWTKEGMLLTLDGAGHSVATGINARGWVVGNGDGINRAFFWDPLHGTFVFLSDDPSQAHDVNDRGQAVGWIGHFIREAVIWRVRP